MKGLKQGLVRSTRITLIRRIFPILFSSIQIDKKTYNVWKITISSSCLIDN
jgi:hypothetical protein